MESERREQSERTGYLNGSGNGTGAAAAPAKSAPKVRRRSSARKRIEPDPEQARHKAYPPLQDCFVEPELSQCQAILDRLIVSGRRADDSHQVLRSIWKEARFGTGCALVLRDESNPTNPPAAALRHFRNMVDSVRNDYSDLTFGFQKLQRKLAALLADGEADAEDMGAVDLLDHIVQVEAFTYLGLSRAEAVEDVIRAAGFVLARLRAWYSWREV